MGDPAFEPIFCLLVFVLNVKANVPLTLLGILMGALERGQSLV